MTDTTHESIPDDAFSLVRGGPTYRLWRRLGLVRHSTSDVLRLPLLAFVVGWVPLVGLALIEALVHGEAPRLVRDFSVHARLALAVPAFCLAEITVDFFSRRASERLFASGFVPGGERDLAQVLAATSRLRDSTLAELVIAFLAVGGSQMILGGVGPWHDATQTLAASEWSLARSWYAWVGLPMFLFLGTRWLWRWSVWAYLLTRIARLRMRPEPLHPDGCGGLALLSEVPSSLAPVAFGFACVASGSWATHILHHDLPLSALRPDLALLVAIIVTLSFGPLVVLAPHLSRARLGARREISRLGLQFSRAFRAQFIRPTPGEGLLETGSLEGLASLHDIAEHVARMRAVPITRRAILVILAATLAPMLPLLLTTFSLTQLAERLVHSMFGTLH